LMGTPALAVVAPLDAQIAVEPQWAYLVYIAIVAGSVGLAVSFMAFILRKQLLEREDAKRMRERVEALEGELHSAQTLLEASPAVALVWEGRIGEGARTRPSDLEDDEGDRLEASAEATGLEDDGPTAIEARLLGHKPSGGKHERAGPLQGGNDFGLGTPKVLGSPVAVSRLLGAGEEPEGPRGAGAISLFDCFLRGLEGDQGERLAAAVRRLKMEGLPFSLQIGCAGGQTFEAEGSPVGQKAVVWLRDVSSDVGQFADLEGRLQKVRQERDALADILNRAPLPIWHRGPDDHLAWVNEAYADAVEHSRDLAVDKDIALHPRLADLGKSARQDGLTVREEGHAVVGGSRRALELVALPLEEGTAGIALDRTDVEEAREELQRHIAAHAETLNGLASAVAIFGTDQRLRYFNRAFTRLWNLDEEWLEADPLEAEVLDRLREERRLPEQADFGSWKKQRLARYKNAIEPLEEMWHLPDGRTLRLISRPHPFGGLIHLYEDVTDQIALESSYNRLINVQRATLDNLYEAVAVFGSDGRLKLHNAEFAEMWELPVERLEGEPHFNLVAKWCGKLVDLADGWHTLNSAVTAHGGARTSVRGQMARRDGVIVQYASTPLPDGRVLVSFVNVTDTTRMERALRERNDALEAADRLKQAFVEHVSYQLRTPLTAIKGFAEMLQSHMFGALNERQDEYTGNILLASEQLHGLIDDILDLATIEAGVMTLEVADVDVAKVIGAAVELSTKKALDAGVSLKRDIDKAVGAMPVDERRVKQMVFNLVSNALAHTPAGGQVTVGADRIEGQVRLWVRDTGIGISPEHQPVVFDRFEAFGG
ncbi:MAG: PAS-domain containing protein, partial [Pseudomonadota bacterium]